MTAPAHRRSLALLLALLACTAQAAPPGGDAAQLRALSQEWMHAIAAKDRPALERLVAPEFVLHAAGDAPADGVPRAEWIGNAVGRDWSEFEYTNMDVRVDGDQAVVMSRLAFRLAPIPFTLDSGIVDTWARRDGRWQVTGRYLGESRFRARVEFVKGFLMAALLFGAFRAFAWMRRRRMRQA